MSETTMPGDQSVAEGSGVDKGIQARSGQVLAPIIAGARARGIADAFEMLGEAAILLDFSGYVLHVSDSAEPLLGCAVTIASSHLTAASRKSAPQLQSLLEAGLSVAGAVRLEEDLLCAEEGLRQRVRLYRVDNSADARQLLCAVLVLEPARRVRRSRARTRRIAESSPA